MATHDSAASGPTAAARAAHQLDAPRPRYGEIAVVAILFACAAVSVVVTAGIVFSLIPPTVQFFQEIPFREFFSTAEWAPGFSDASYGVFNIVAGTLNVTFYAILIALPFGLGAAIYLSEYAGHRIRGVLKPALEVLEGIPTVAYGLFALTFVTPLLQDVWPTFLPGALGEPPGVFSSGSAGVVLGIMIIPTVASISEDAMSAVPRGLREGAYAMGSTRMQVATRVVVPSALSGIVASFVLGISRAIGETMVVLMAAGASPNLTLMPNESVQTMTAFIAQTATGDIAIGTITYKTIFAVGALLFTITLIMNLISIRLVRRYREIYE